MTKRVWRGRVRDRVWKAFVALDGQKVRTTDIIERVWPRKSKWHPEEYRKVREAAAELAEVVGRGPGRGRPWLWRLGPQHDCDIEKKCLNSNGLV
jgi:hypothetical protein